MSFAQLFFQRHDVLYSFWLAGFWDAVSDVQMRQRPHPQVNSIAWNLWHLARVEDAGVNRFVADLSQVIDEGGWSEKLHLPWRHHGSGMTLDEVDELNQRINLPALREYSWAVAERTQQVVASVALDELDAVLTLDRVRQIVVGEGLGHSDPAALVQNYTGWTKGKCLMNFALTHPYQHVGEMGVIASLLDVAFD
jgi:hypothetical protein